MGTPLYNTDIIPLTSRPTLTVMDDGDYFVILDTSTGKISKILKTNLVLPASQVSYDNATSGLTATQVQAALDELVVNLGSSDSAISALGGRLDTLEGDELTEGSVAKTVKDAVTPIDERIDNILVGQDLDPNKDVELLDARVSAYTGSHSTTPDRLNYEEKLRRINTGGIDRGMISLPADFVPTPPCDFYRDFDGRIKHNMDFTQYQTGAEIYVDLVNGNDSTGDGTTTTPYKTLKKAFYVITASEDTSFQIIVKSNAIFTSETVAPSGLFITNKNVSIRHVDGNEIIITTAQSAMSWTQESAGVYKATCSTVNAVYDLTNKDVFGVYKSIPNVATLQECIDTVNTWYTDDTLVYVHRADGAVPSDSNTVIDINLNATNFLLYGTSVLYLENITVLAGRNGNGTYFLGDGDGTNNATIIANNCRFVGGTHLLSSSVVTNAFSTNNIKNTYLFNCIACYSGTGDGFNYHYPKIPSNERRGCFVLEYECLSYDNGLLSPSGINNATSIHEGASILRIGCIGYRSTGPVLADVNGCYTICIDCDMHDAHTLNGDSYLFQFDETAGGKAVLINCSSGNPRRYDLNNMYPQYGSVYVKRFLGNLINHIEGVEIL